MAEGNIEDRVEKLLKEKIENLGYELYDIEYLKVGKEYHLCIYIDKNGIMDITDCEKVNEVIDPILDKADIISEQYFLEVSSSGLEKKLRKIEHYKKQLGNKIEVNLFTKMNDKKIIQGILTDITENDITIKDNDEELKIEFSKISNAKSVYNWED